MKSFVPDFHIQSAKSLQTALRMLSDESENWRPLAGGTDLMVLFEAGKLPAGKYLNIWGVPELKGIVTTSEYVELGALTTYSEVLEHPTLQAEFHLLCQAAKATGAVAIQNRGTLGGNIVNASPAADSPPALLVYDTEIELASARGSRWTAYENFHFRYKEMDIKPGELLTKIRIKRNTKNLQQYYRKVGTRKAQAISKVCMAAVATVEKQKIIRLRLAFGSVAPIPLRCKKTEACLLGQVLGAEAINQALDTLSAEIAPIDDIRSNKEYRKKVAVNLVRDFLETL